jgi:outer membrane protein assembly factor BamB
MKRLILSALAFGLTLPLAADWTMQAGDLRRDHRSGASSIQGPVREAWVGQLECDFGSPVVDPLIFGDKVVAVNAGGIVAWSRTDGHFLWSHVTPVNTAPVFDPSANALYYSDMDGDLTALSADTGAMLWVQPGYCGVTLADGQLLALTGGSSQYVVSLDLSTRAVLWKVLLPSTKNPLVPAYDAGILYVANTDGTLSAVDTTKHTRLWWTTTGKAQNCVPALSDNLVILQTQSGLFVAFNRSNGTKAWTYQAGSWGSGSVAICNQMVIGANDDRSVFGLDLATGKRCWQTYTNGNFAQMSPLVVCDKVFIAGCASRWYGLDGANGAFFDTHDILAENDWTDFAESNGQLVACDEQGRPHCFVALKPGDPAQCSCDLACGMTPSATPSPTPLATAGKPCDSQMLATYNFESKSLASSAPALFPNLSWQGPYCASSAPVYLFDGVGTSLSNFTGSPAFPGEGQAFGDATWLASAGRSLRFAYQIECYNYLENALVDWRLNNAAVMVSQFGDLAEVSDAFRVRWTTAQGWQQVSLPAFKDCGPLNSQNAVGSATAARPGRVSLELSRVAGGMLLTLSSTAGTQTWLLADLAADPASLALPDHLCFGNFSIGGAPLAGYVDDISILSCPQPTATATPTMSSTATVTLTISPTPSSSPTASPSATITATPSITGTFTPSATITLTGTTTPSATATPTLGLVLPCPCAGRAVLANSGSAMLDAASEVDGDVQAAGSITLQPNSILKGGMLAKDPGERAPVPVPADAVEEGTILVGSGQTLSLPAGDYHAGSLTVQLGGSLIAQGPVRLWVDGAIVLGGLVKPASGASMDLWILSGGSQDFHINSQAQVTAVIDVPLASALVDAPLLGCLTSKDATINSNGHVTKDSGLSCPGVASAPTAVPVDQEAGGASVTKALAVPNPIVGGSNNQVCVKLAADADKLVFSIYSKSMVKMAEWQATGMRGTWICDPIPSNLSLPNGTYVVQVKAIKGSSTSVKSTTLVVLR